MSLGRGQGLYTNMQKEEFEELSKEISPPTDAEISEQFLKEFRELCLKYNRDFGWNNPEPKIIKVNFQNAGNK